MNGPAGVWTRIVGSWPVLSATALLPYGNTAFCWFVSIQYYIFMVHSCCIFHSFFLVQYFILWIYHNLSILPPVRVWAVPGLFAFAVPNMSCSEYYHMWHSCVKISLEFICRSGVVENSLWMLPFERWCWRIPWWSSGYDCRGQGLDPQWRNWEPACPSCGQKNENTCVCSIVSDFLRPHGL